MEDDLPRQPGYLSFPLVHLIWPLRSLSLMWHTRIPLCAIDLLVLLRPTVRHTRISLCPVYLHCIGVGGRLVVRISFLRCRWGALLDCKGWRGGTDATAAERALSWIGDGAWRCGCYVRDNGSLGGIGVALLCRRV